MVNNWFARAHSARSKHEGRGDSGVYFIGPKLSTTLLRLEDLALVTHSLAIPILFGINKTSDL